MRSSKDGIGFQPAVAASSPSIQEAQQDQGQPGLVATGVDTSSENDAGAAMDDGEEITDTELTLTPAYEDMVQTMVTDFLSLCGMELAGSSGSRYAI